MQWMVGISIHKQHAIATNREGKQQNFYQEVSKPHKSMYRKRRESITKNAQIQYGVILSTTTTILQSQAQAQQCRIRRTFKMDGMLLLNLLTHPYTKSIKQTTKIRYLFETYHLLVYKRMIMKVDSTTTKLVSTVNQYC